MTLYPGLSGEFLVLAGDVVIALANQLAVDPPDGPGLGSAASGGNIKTNELVHRPDSMIMVTADFSPKQRIKISRIALKVYVRDTERPAALTVVGQVVNFLHMQVRRLTVPNKGTVQFYFEWDQFETFYRDQVRRLVFPLSFTAYGHPVV